MNILIVDGVKSVRENISSICREEGHSPVAVPNGLDGAHYLKTWEGKTDLVIASQQLPEMDAGQMLRMAGGFLKAPVYILSHGNLCEYGAVAGYIKNYSPGTLEAVRKVIKEHENRPDQG
ncbi:hypothetical protein ACFLZB_03350 [Nanoarchaeota archaeon]